MDLNQKITIIRTRVDSPKYNYSQYLYDGFISNHFNNVNLQEAYYPIKDKCDLLCIWAHKEKHLFDIQKRRNKNYLIMERAYLADRYQWISLGYNGLNGRADFCNKQITDLTRWNKHFSHLIQPWKYNSMKNGEYALVIGQMKGDAAIPKGLNIESFYKHIISKLNRKGIPVLFRNHPLSKIKFNDPSLKYMVDINTNLEDSLKDAKFTVTLNSNSGVLSVLAGIPCITYDQGSMIYNIASHDIDENLVYKDRSDWQAKIAWTQWSIDEIRNGEAIHHLKSKLI